MDLTSKEPMGTVWSWIQEFGGLGASAGLALALTVLGVAPAVAGESVLPFVLLTTLFVGIQGAFAGLVGGSILRGLQRTKSISAIWGILLSSFAANAAASSLVMIEHDVFAPAVSAIQGRATPLSIAVMVLIPILTVLRYRGKRTLPWAMAIGFLAGALVGLSHL